MDIGLLMLAFPGKAREIARRTEAAGFTHLALGDTQNLGPETWSQLMLVAGASERIRIGTGVTNTTTRDVAVTASAALALQQESGGRVFCGIGRGDSALAKIGRKPAAPEPFEADLASLRAYLGGDTTQRGAAKSRIEWSQGLSVPRVPIEVAVSGPRVLEIAARHADAFINCAVDEDLERARAIARGGVSVFARFAGWSEGARDLGDTALRAEARPLADRYEMDRHAQAAGEGARALDDAHLDRFAIVGSVEHAAARLRELAQVGLDFVTIAPGSSDMDWETGWKSIERIGREVIPALR